ncbi:hypothetical protein V6N13_041024 [Hibiscus sabdariffa]|uniref:MSP domain-containing protein n=1 Tax=Hibiscus sabdariffa TaxID=183260 RepID=A0ABR2RAH4_9ROSI
MSTGDLLNVDPVELKFPFELKKQISCSIQLSNKTDNHVAFKVKTTNPKKYCVRPNTGIVLPKSACEVTVTMQAQKEVPADMQCKDKFLLQTVKAPDGATPKDVTAEMFNREAGNVVEECKLRVVYVFSPQHTPAPDGSEVTENGQANAAEFVMAARTFTDDVQDKSTEAKALMTKLTEEKNKAIQQNNKLRQELVSGTGRDIYLKTFHHLIDFVLSLYLSPTGLSCSFDLYEQCKIRTCKSYKCVGTAEARNQQKWWWSVIHACCLVRLDRISHGVHHEEIVNLYGSSWLVGIFFLYFPSG